MAFFDRKFSYLRIFTTLLGSPHLWGMFADVPANPREFASQVVAHHGGAERLLEMVKFSEIHYL